MNTVTTEWPGAPITGRWFEEQGGLLASGQGALKRGQVLSLADDGKWYKYSRELIQTAANNNGSRGTAQNAVVIVAGTTRYTFLLEHSNIVPGTLTIKSHVDANDSHQYSDDGRGRLSGDSGDGQHGSVDYESGLVVIEWAQDIEVGNVLASYRHRADDNKGIPAGVLKNYEVDTTGADKGAAIVVIGEVLLDKLIWFTGISATERARGVELIRARQIYGAAQ